MLNYVTGLKYSILKDLESFSLKIFFNGNIIILITV